MIVALMKLTFVTIIIFLCYMVGFNSGYNRAYDYVTNSEREDCKKQIEQLQNTRSCKL